MSDPSGVENALPSYTQYGWVGGSANDNNEADASFFAIGAMQVDGTSVSFTYDWENGEIDGTLSGTQLIGRWTQSNGSGPQEIDFDANGNFVSGWWADDGDSTHHAAFLLE